METYPAEKNLAPIYYKISIGNRTYRIVGGGTSVNFPNLDTLPGGRVHFTPPGYPTPDRFVDQVSGSILPSIPGGKGGTYMESASLGGSDDVDDGLTSNIIHVLRVMPPIR